MVKLPLFDMIYRHSGTGEILETVFDLNGLFSGKPIVLYSSNISTSKFLKTNQQ